MVENVGGRVGKRQNLDWEEELYFNFFVASMA